MFSAIQRRLSYANVAATLALVFSMSGSALAAKRYLLNSTKQINPKVLKKLKGKEGHSGKEGPAGPGGKEGPQGAQGPAGATGAIGPSDVYQISSNASGTTTKTLKLEVPAGDYAIVAKALGYNPTSKVAETECLINPSEGVANTSAQTLQPSAVTTYSNPATDQFSVPSTITYACYENETGVQYYNMIIVATKVGAIG